jgi:nucleoside-diphosphate-sugar epimerase
MRHATPQAVILGAGFTGSRVAQLLRKRGWTVICANRSGSEGLLVDVNDRQSLERLRDAIPPGTVVLHSIPVRGIMDTLSRAAPARVVYLSTTGVYGAAPVVDEKTPVGPRTERELLRVAEEQAVLGGPWTSIVLRPAAIYGPGRGVHASMRAGKYRLPAEDANFVSRIHVDDLARHAEAAMASDLTGAFPVADQEPCTSLEIARYCARLLGLPIPEQSHDTAPGETRHTDRRVDGSAIRRLLGLTLKYPTYREGIAACLEAEARAFSTS